MNALTRLTFRLFKIPAIKLETVFTPTKAAILNYISRQKIDDMLKDEMSIPGKQILVYGHSGSGKTSSVRNLLKKGGYAFVITQCESSTTFEQLLLNAFDSLDAFIVSEKKQAKKYSFSKKLESEYHSIKMSIGQTSTQENSVTMTRLLPPQLTPQKLAQFMGKAGIVCIIEDFHKVSEEEKKRIADVIKIFVDNSNEYPISKIICIGACESAHELVSLDPNLKNRVSEVSVPLLNEAEIKSIVTNGFKLLNVVPCDSIIDKLVYYSDRLGASVHQMCMDICKKEGIERTKFKKMHIEDKSFQYAIEGFINRSSDTFKSIYEAAVKNELGWYILRTFSRNTMEKLSFSEVQRIVNSKNRNFDKDSINEKLQELSSPAFGIIYYNKNSGKYALTSPFWHRFLRMQFSIELAAQNKKKNNNRNKNLKLIDQNDRDSIVDNTMLELIERLKKIESLIS